MTITRNSLSIALLLAVASPALAHGGDHPQHGGQVVLVGETAFELVVAPAGVSLYVVEDGDDINSANVTARLTATIGGKRSEIAMLPAGGNRFVARGARLPRGTRVGVLIVNSQTKARQSATFSIN